MDPLADAMTSDFAATWLPAVFVPLIVLVTPAIFIVLVGRHITATD
jgi:photosystem I subunit 8